MSGGDDKSQIMNGKGAFFYYNPITVDEHSSQLKKSQQERQRIIKLHHNSTSLKGDILVTDDGFIGILNQDDEEVIKILNTIFATIYLYLNIQSAIVRSGELCNFSWNKEKSTLEINAWTINERNTFSMSRDQEGDYFYLWLKTPRKIIAPQEMENMIKTSFLISSEMDLHLDLLLLYDCLTLFRASSYTAAYLFSWMMVETFIDTIWNRYVESLNRSRKDKDSLKDHNRWTTYHHIEFLSGINLMGNSARDVLHGLRKVRNGIVHNKKQVGEKVSLRCIRVADILLRNRINKNPNIFEGVDVLIL